MNAQHTPGPWTGQDENGNFNSAHAWSVVHKTASYCGSAPIWAHGNVIAFAVYSSDSFVMSHIEKVADNARLIAAAPDLLAALGAILRAYTTVYGYGDLEMQPAIYQARTAISKATGGGA